MLALDPVPLREPSAKDTWDLRPEEVVLPRCWGATGRGEAGMGWGDAHRMAGSSREHLQVVSRQEGVPGSACVWLSAPWGFSDV